MPNTVNDKPGLDAKASLEELVKLAGLPGSAAQSARIEGKGPVFPTRYDIVTPGAAVIAATGVAAADLWKLKTGRQQDVRVDARAAQPSALAVDDVGNVAERALILQAGDDARERRLALPFDDVDVRAHVVERRLHLAAGVVARVVGDERPADDYPHVGVVEPDELDHLVDGLVQHVKGRRYRHAERAFGEVGGQLNEDQPVDRHGALGRDAGHASRRRYLARRKGRRPPDAHAR